MLKRSITYTNSFTEREVTEEHYFHISKSDLIEMEMEENKSVYTNKDGNKFTGMQAKLQQIVDSEDGKAIMAEFKEIIRRSYGRKDGDRFTKSSAIWEDFSSSEAYSQFLFEICTDAEAAANFVNGIIPKNMEQIASEVKAKNEVVMPPIEQSIKTDIETRQHTEDHVVKTLDHEREREVGAATPEDPVDLTSADLRQMDHTVLKSGLADGRYKLS